MERRPSKLRRLYADSCIPHQKLAKVLQKLRSEPDLADAIRVSRYQLARSIVDFGNIVGKVVNHNGFDWHIVSLRLALQHLVEESPAFRGMLKQTWEKRPCTPQDPYNLILYGDEVVPGNVLRLENKRKVMCWYISVREFGPRILKHESAWIPLVVLRTGVCKDLPGGISSATGVLLRNLLLDDVPLQQGVLLDLGAAGIGHVRLIFRLGNVLADAEAHRAMWSIKGAAGKLPCPCCRNVVADKDVVTDGVHHISTAGPQNMMLASSREWFLKADMVAARRPPASTKAAFEALQTATGLTYDVNSLLWDAALRGVLRPAETFTFDPMHTFVSNGVANTELDCLLRQLHNVGVLISDIRTFMRPWHLCSALGSPSDLQGIFSPARERHFRETRNFKLGAAECLLVFPLLAFFLRKIVARSGRLLKEVDSFEHFACVLHLYRKGKEGVDIANELADAIVAHGAKFREAYPQEDPKPKSHYAHHIPMQLRRDGVLIDAFVGERKHQGIKAAATPVCNTRAFERTVLFTAFARQVASMEEDFTDGLISARECPELASLLGESPDMVRFAPACRWTGTKVRDGDLLLLDDLVYFSKGYIAVCDTVYVLGEPHEMLEQVTPFAWRLRPAGHVSMIALAGKRLRLASGWYFDAGEVVAVL